ncbi:EF-P beta-lysylation protein EpmB [Thalassotalea ponticola]|uniref:EF-P beta-lysylation protein EpmB n=1 Tax=Thalassotalea ponticola TaxID=1523392 RepID=UPI0025B402F6|nr:EF-P beta-lysylation protein EpmB [Thalassotalea ponticola]MDN3653710.1 EF-P beta-lysylation protein EpmB [Thalassotalea ponticola]
MTQIITRIEDNVHSFWEKELANVVTDPKQLLSMLNIDEKQYRSHFNARKLFPVRVPRPFIAKMQCGKIDDPLLRQVMPSSEEFVDVEGFISDPLEEHNTVAEGLLHKYHNRVLMIVKAGCAVNCRYCFRRHFPYQDNSPNKQRWQPALDYISAHDELNEVIFSGGDPLMAKDSHLQWLVDKVSDVSHIKRLRIHTRLPVVIPKRINQALLDTLSQTRLQVVMVLHINHSNELCDDLAQAVAQLRQHNVLVLNQSVLLKGVNDDSAVLCELSERLFDIGVIPYYLHLLDPVKGAAHFNVELSAATTIAKQMMANLPGFLMPKVVQELAGEANKTPINLSLC